MGQIKEEVKPIDIKAQADLDRLKEETSFMKILGSYQIGEL